MKASLKKVLAVLMSACMLISNIDITAFASVISDIKLTDNVEYTVSYSALDVAPGVRDYDFAANTSFAGIYADFFPRLEIVTAKDKTTGEDLTDELKGSYVYCLDATKAADSGGTTFSDETISSYFSGLGLADSQEAERRANYVNYAIMYGYTDKLKYYKSETSSVLANEDEHWLATQIMIWNIRHGWFENLSRAQYESAALAEFTRKLNNDSTDGVDISKATVLYIYNKMKENVINHDLVPKFLSTRNYWSYDSSTDTYSCTFESSEPISKEELAKFNFYATVGSVTSGKVSVTLSDNKITFKTATGYTPPSRLSFDFTKTANSEFQAGVQAIAITTQGNLTTQPMVYYTTDGAKDPPNVALVLELSPTTVVRKIWDRTIGLTTENIASLNSRIRFYMQYDYGNPSYVGLYVVATDDDGDGTYQYTGLSTTPTSFKLSDDGTFEVEGLELGRYEITENGTVAGYSMAEPLTVSVTAASGDSATFINTQDSGIGEIKKEWTIDPNMSEEEKALLEGHVYFTVKHSSGLYVNATATEVDNVATGEYTFTSASDTAQNFYLVDGTFHIDNLPTGTYTVTEYSTLENFSVDSAKTLTVTKDTTSSVSFTNIQNSDIEIIKEFEDIGYDEETIKEELAKVTFTATNSTKDMYLKADKATDDLGEEIKGSYINAVLTATQSEATTFATDADGIVHITLSSELSAIGASLVFKEHYDKSADCVYTTDTDKVVVVTAQNGAYQSATGKFLNPPDDERGTIYKEWSTGSTLSDNEKKELEETVSFTVKRVDNGMYVNADNITAGVEGEYTFTKFSTTATKFSLKFASGANSAFFIDNLPIGVYEITETILNDAFPSTRVETLTVVSGTPAVLTFKNVENTKIVIQKDFEDSAKLDSEKLKEEFGNCVFTIKRNGTTQYLSATKVSDGVYNNGTLSSTPTEFYLDENGKLEIMLSSALSSLNELTDLVFTVTEAYNGTYYKADSDKQVVIESNENGYYSINSIGFTNLIKDGQGNIKKVWSNEESVKGTLSADDIAVLENSLTFSVKKTDGENSGKYVSASATAVAGRYNFSEYAETEMLYKLNSSLLEFTNLPVGTYEITEYSTLADYPAKQTKSLTVADGGVSTVEFVNVENTEISLEKHFSDESDLTSEKLKEEYANVFFVIKSGDKFLNAAGDNGIYTDGVLSAVSQSFVLDSNGKLNIKLSAALSASGGTFTVTEYYTGEDYTAQSPRTITYKANTSGYVSVPTVSFTNTLKSGGIEIDKSFLDKDGNSVAITDAQLTEVVFNVTDEKGNYVTFTGSNGSYSYSGTTSDAENAAVKLSLNSTTHKLAISDLPSKTSYTVSEVSGITYFTSNISETYEISPGKTVMDVFVNEPQTGDLIIQKVNPDGKLSGWKFKVEYVDNKFEGYTYSNEFVTDAYGKISVSDLRVGKYKITEIVDDDDTAIYFTAESKTVEVEFGNTASITMTNTPKGSIEVKKVDKDYTDVTLSGATFVLYKDNGTIGAYDEGVDELYVQLTETSTGSGIYKVTDIPYGKYLLKETKAPKGYTVDTKYYAVSIDYGGETEEITMPNNSELIDFYFLKECADGNISGWTFEVECVDSIYDGYTYKKQFATDDTGRIDVSDVRPGVYTITEIVSEETKKKYITADPITVDLTDKSDGSVTFAGTVTNTPIGSVYVKKVDVTYPDVLLSGAVFNVYDDVDGNGVYNSATDTLVGTLSEFADGEYQLDNLEYGNYLLKEIKAPENYLLDTNYYAFSITKGGDFKKIETKLGVGFENNPMTGSLEIIKKTPDGKLDGWKFRVELIDSEFEKAVYNYVHTTDTNGRIYISDLRIGTYKVTEITTGITGYFTPEAQNAVIEYNEKATVTMENTPYGSVHVTKVDEDYPDNKLTGAEFTVYGADKATVIGKLTEISDGEYQLDKLPYGDYFLKETVAPENYVLDNSYYSFSITEAGAVVEVETEAGKNFINNPQTGNLVIQKKSEDGKLEGWKFRIELVSSPFADYSYDATYITDVNGKISVSDLRIGTYRVTELTEGIENYFTPEAKEIVIKSDETTADEMENIPYGSVCTFKVDKKFPNKKLTGAEFTVYDTDKVTVIGTLSEISTGEYFLDELPFGTYYLKETKAPENYVLDNNFYEFVIDKTGEKEIVETEIGKGFVNAPQTGSLVINKYSADGVIEGWRFTVKLIDTPLENYTYEQTFVTDENGRIEVNNLIIGKYEISEETDGVVGYFTAENKTIEIKADTKTSIGMTNTPFGSIVLNKVNDEDTSVLLPGAVYNIYNDINENGTYEEDIDTFYGTLDDLDDDGIYTREEMPIGFYLVKEIEAPEGYLVDENYYSIVISLGGEEKTVANDENGEKFLEVPVKGSVHVSKVDADYNDIKLTGAEFTVYASDKTTSVGTLIEVSEGEYELTGLLYGNYYLQETKAPEYFVRDVNFYPFSITEHGEVVFVGNTDVGDSFLNEAQTGSLKVVKTAYDGKVEGVSFDITVIPEVGKTETFTVMTDENGEINLDDIRVGKVIVHEVRNEVTQHYVLPPDKTIVIEHEEVALVSMYNDKPDSPPTGSDLENGLWVVIGLISIAVAFEVSRQRYFSTADKRK